MPIKPRRPFDDEKPNGYLESDVDFVLNNLAVCVALLERLPAVLDADDLSHKERIELVYEIVEEAA